MDPNDTPLKHIPRPEDIYRRLNRLAEEERQLRSLLRLSLRVIRSDAKADSAEVVRG